MLYMLIISMIAMFAIIFSYTLGLKNGQALTNKKELESINPVKRIKKELDNYQHEKEVKDEVDRVNIIMDNINSYDGTSNGQKEVI